MKNDRTGQVWEINVSDSFSDYKVGLSKWKAFTVVSTSQEEYETIAGTSRNFVKHRCLVSENEQVVDLNEDVSIPWEECSGEYRRIA